MQTSIDQVIETCRRRRFLDGLAADFAALREDAGEWLIGMLRWTTATMHDLASRALKLTGLFSARQMWGRL